MGQLTVTVGTVTGARSFNNAIGAVVIQNYIAAYEGPVAGTDQEKLDWLVAHLAAHLQAVHAGYKRQAAREQVDSDTEAGLEEL